MATYPCRKCGISKPASDFWRLSKDGTPSGWCRACQSESCRRSQERHGWRSAYKAQETYRAAHPERVRCVYRWSKYRQRHVLDLGTCRIPGCNAPAEGHHPDYRDPYTVVLVCRAHHMAYESGRLAASKLPAPVTFPTRRAIKPISPLPSPLAEGAE